MIFRPTFKVTTGGFLYSVFPTNGGFKLEIDGTTICNIPLISAATFPLAPVTTTNGNVVVVDVESYNFKISISNLKVWEKVSAKVTFTYGSYTPFEQLFELYGYDLGNPVNSGGANVSSNNPDFMIVMSDMNNEGRIITYRKPFTKKIYYYKASNSSTVHFNDGTNDLGTINGFVSSQPELTITGETLVTGDHVHSVIVSEFNWIPEFNLSVDSTNCNDDCFYIDSPVTASIGIDYTTLDTLYVDDVESYPYQDQRIEYTLYDSAGTALDQKHYGFQISVPTVFDPVPYIWNNIVLPDYGDYIIQVCLAVYGLNTTVTIDSSVPNEGEWYRIIDNTGANDFTVAGSPDNLVNTEFMANGIIPVWDGGILLALGKVAECCTREKVKGCIPYEIKQAGCNTFQVFNRSFNPIVVDIAEMDSNGVFNPLSIGNQYTLNQGEAVEITHEIDNVYTYTITDATAGTTYTYVIFNYCQLRTCLLDYINKLICKCDNECSCDDACINYCKDFYDFNSLVITAHTYFNMLNQEYGFNYVYTSLDPSKVSELYQAKQVLDRFADYCSSCNSKCNCS